MLLAWIVGACGHDPYTVGVGSGFDPELGLGANVDLWVAARVPEDYPGAAVLVMKDDVVELSRAYGLLRLDAADPATTSTPFYLSEVSMPFTAMAALMLHEQGLLDLHARVADILPDVPEPWRNITVHHLLSLSSGLSDYLVDLDIGEPGLTNDEALEAIKAAPLQSAAGSAFRFDRSAYLVLAEIIELVAEQPYRVFVQENVFDPLGMDRSYVVDETDPEVPDRPTGYGGPETVSDHEIRTVGDGGLYASLEDMRKWLQGIDEHSLLSPETTALMYTSHEGEGYGYGWHVDDLAGHVGYRAEGWHRGFRSFVGTVPDVGLTVVVLTSGAYSWPAELPGIILAQLLGL